MKILLTTDNIGGVWTYSLNLAGGLIKNGIDVSIVVIGNDLTEYQKMELDFVPWYFIRSKQEWMDDPWDDIENAGYELKEIAKAVQPDVVHLNSFSFGALGWNVPVVVTAHSCVLSWWEAVRHETAPGSWNIYREFAGKGIRNADAVVAPGFTMMRYVEKYYQPLKYRAVINNGAEASGFRIAPKENFVFSMGRLWDEAKNIKLLVRASEDIGYPVFIAGEHDGMITSDAPNNVHFLGRLTQAQIAGWLSEAALYVLPVLYEPFGYTFLEAALSGCAVVTGDIDSMRELWPDSVAFVDPKNSKELADTVNSLMIDRERRELLGRKAYDIALSRYSLGRMVSEYSSLYSNVLKESSKNLRYQEL
ncbi:MAG TPA: glycosyltransferase family 4 protein [Bacteroidales bacterium]|nr:glycosyltransferase family 4 protein [Bacteroidales bacterium]